MNFEIGKIYNGFKLLEEKNVKEVNSISRLFTHEKTGAKLIYLSNEDNNKVFTIGFRTPPEDSTGVPHIIEHSVLSGSTKYRTKEPFMDLIKGSLQTFLNAMTYPDKTIYPVASRNDKDFQNLMDVYLDSVFNPRIYEMPEIFMQEGWHYEIMDKDSPIEYKGVVYNEMRGAYSSAESLLGERISQSLFPDTIYRHSSGGDPYIIPELTHENFLKFHTKYYHPSNSYIYLYGDGDVLEHLSYIDKEYLSNFDKKEIDTEIPIQNAIKNDLVEYYPIAQDESDENKDYLSLNFVIGKATDKKDSLMNEILNDVLINSTAGPIKEALLDAGIGEDIIGSSSGGIQPAFSIIAKNASENQKDKFKEVIFNTLNKLIKEGIDKKLIEATINKLEYSLREAGGYATVGIVYGFNIFDTWLYDGDPLANLEYEETIKFFREALKTNYYEDYIQKNFIENNHQSLVILKPQKGLAEEKDKIIEEQLASYKASLTADELDALIEENKALEKFQLSEDTIEDKNTIPKLLIEDVNNKPLQIDQDIYEKDVTILHHDLFTSGIIYLDLVFDLKHIEKDLVPYVSLLAQIVGSVDTKNYSYGDLSNEIYINTGGIYLNISALSDKKSDDFYPKLMLTSKVIRQKTTELFNLIKELITNTKLEDKKRIKEIINQIKSRIEMNIYSSGHAVASGRVTSYFSKPGKYLELISGLDFLWFIEDLAQNFDDKSDSILENLQKAYDLVFNKNGLIVNVTGEKEDLELVKKNLNIVKDVLNEEKYEEKIIDLSVEKLNEGILSSSNVQYVSKGYNLKQLGYEYNGNMSVLSTILSRDYLHNWIRAKGGAYGAGISFNLKGDVSTYSYRDPNLVETLKVYDNLGEYLKNLILTKDDLTNYIIGTMNKLDPPLTASQKGQIGLSRYITHLEYGDVKKQMEEVLSTTEEQIKSYAKLLEKIMQQNYLCVFGNETKIKQNKDVFLNLVPLKK
ncbi:insulinase family protein [Tissierella creatinophila]|uniref:Protease 3 n=1 Tax=Tissierella creatinophila DSM 6911 TaxID=1123403 RepID=A0A1U7M939_TISCR|nr:insulinase family protein [Tissierella creatinophila]OLS03817.1 protease 3 precursor [Tissierella creatinophila DSM 6911]